MGPRTEPVPFDQYAEVRYVSIEIGSDNFGDGTIGDPWYSVVHALNEITDATEGKKYAILVARGRYGSFTINMKPWVDLYGGFEEVGWTRDVVTNVTVLDGEDQRRVVTGAANSKIDGLKITGGISDTGGGIKCDNCSPIISNCFISGNQAISGQYNPARGGGADFVGSSSAVLNCIISENQCGGFRPDQSGGGIGITSFSNVFLGNCVVSHNLVWGFSNRGGGIVCDQSNPTVCNCIIYDNTAERGAGICSNGDNPIIANTIFWGNNSSQIFPNPTNPLTVFYCLVPGGYPGERNLNEDPLFVDPVNGDFHLQSGSPCIGKGVGPTVFDKVPLFDIDGDPRSGNTCDIGADEFAQEEPVSTETPTFTQTPLPSSTPTITPTIDPSLLDDDLDGVPNVIENSAGNDGDGNKDGIPDRIQSYVASLPNAGDGRYVSLVCLPPTASLAHVRAATSAGETAPPIDLPFPLGFFSFEITGAPSATGAGLLILLPGSFEWSSYTKYGPTPEDKETHWYPFTFDGSTGLLSNGANTLLLWFKDGVRGDDDLTLNGTISDIGGPVGIETNISQWRTY